MHLSGFSRTLGQTLTGTSLRQPVGIMLSLLWIDNLYVKNNSIIAELQVVRIRKINSFRHIVLAVGFCNNFQFLLTVPSIDGPANKETYHLLHFILFWKVKNQFVACMLVHLNEQQKSCTCFKKGLQRNYCLRGCQVSLRDICYLPRKVFKMHLFA